MKEILIDAISNIDDDIIDDYFAVKERLDKNYSKQRNIIQNRHIWTAIAACISILFIGVIVLNLIKTQDGSSVSGGDEWNDSNFGSSSEITYNTLGDVVGTENNYVVINNVYLTHEIEGKRGNYLVFSGVIHSETIKFDEEEMLDYDLSLYLSNVPADQHFVECEKELSQALSETKLIFYGQEGRMNGSFCIVYSISDIEYEIIAKKESKRPYEAIYFALRSGGGAYIDYGFTLTDVQNVYKIEK